MRRLLPWLVLVGCKGADGPDGSPGLACWDANANGTADASEDANGDGSVDVRDCSGIPGADGNNGTNGANGNNGQDGADGAIGTSCWDLDGDGVQDPAEDVNADSQWDARDCIGNRGDNGLACWDLNGNHVGDAGEDLNGDGVWTSLDCQVDATATLDGIVVDADSRGLIAGAMVAVSPTGDWTTTGPDGRFSFANMPFGVYRIVVSAPGLKLEGNTMVNGTQVSTSMDGVSLLAGDTVEAKIKLARINRAAMNLTTIHTGSSASYTSANCSMCHGDRSLETSADPAEPPYHALTVHSSKACTSCHSTTSGVSIDNDDGWTFESAATLRKQVDVKTACTTCHTCYPSDFCTTTCPTTCP